MNPLENWWWKLTVAQWSLKLFHSMTAQALHHFSYKTKSYNFSISCSWERKKDIIIFMRAQGALNKCCWKGNIKQRLKTKKPQEDCGSWGFKNRVFCGGRITIHRCVVLGQRLLLWQTVPQPLPSGDINHSWQDAQLAQEGFQNLTGSKIASKQVSLI